MSSREAAALAHEREQLIAQLAQARLFLNTLRHQWLLSDGVARAQIEIRLTETEQQVRATEDRLDAIDARLQERASADDSSRSSQHVHDPAFTFDACISYREAEPDLTWVWEALIPRLEAAGLRYACAGDTPPGVPRLIGTEEIFAASRRVLAVLTESYLAGSSTRFESIMAQAESIQGGLARLIPIFLDDILLDNPPAWVPLRLNPLVVNPVVLGPAAVARGQRIPRLDPWARLIHALQSPLPAF